MDDLKCFPCEEEVDLISFESRIGNIYKALMDETSKTMFSCRMMYSLTYDYRYIRDILKNIKAGCLFYNKLMSDKKRNIYIYGAGIKGTRLALLFPEINWKGYIDKNKTGTLNGVLIRKPTAEIIDCLRRVGGKIVVSNTMNPDNIRDDLVNKGISEENIIILRDYDLMAGKEIYFDDEVLQCVHNIQGAFIDVGCYDGADTINYFKKFGNMDTAVFAIEADKSNYENCKDALHTYKNVSLLNVGLSDKEEIVSFNQINSSNSRFSEDGNVKVKTIPLDDLIKNQEVGFIKMDIEGYEEKAIKGAAKIIGKHHPVMAISIYHKRSDIWRLPELLLELNSGYRFYLRHYTIGVTDTVLYAIDKRNLI